MNYILSDSYEPDLGFTARALRRLTEWRNAKQLDVVPKRTIVTFTFDDFPKSAADAGADIVESIGGKATYYACSGFVGSVTTTGKQYSEYDLKILHAAGHEIGAHTDGHIDCWRTPQEETLADIDLNLKKLQEMGVTAPVPQFAYPYGETQFALKQALISRFRAARGIRTGVNRKGADLMQLRSVELSQDSSSTDRALAMIEAAARDPGWLILFTHDVTTAPSAFGVKPGELKRVAQRAKDVGAIVATMTEALDLLYERSQ